MNDLIQVGQSEMCLMCQFIIRMLNHIEIDESCNLICVRIDNEDKIRRCLDYMTVGYVTKSFLASIIDCYPDQDGYGYNFDSLDDALKHIEEGISCLSEWMNGNYKNTHQFIKGISKNSNRNRPFQLRYSYAIKAKKKIENLMEVYRRSCKYTPDYKTIESVCKYAFEKHWLPCNLEDARRDARNSARQLRALGFVA